MRAIAWSSICGRLTLSPVEPPVFEEPWQARAFALAVLLSERGLFTWTEWTQMLGAEIAEGHDYWTSWLAALEKASARPSD